VRRTERTEMHHRKARYAKVIEHVEGHYESEKVPFGRVYRWCAECVVLECGCGERVTLVRDMNTCVGCGADHASIVRERLANERAQDDEALRPWHLARDCEGNESLPC
jgi:hypothetical protein